MPADREGNAEKIAVLMYHRIGAALNAWERKYCVSPDRFAAHMQALARGGYTACSMEQFIAWLRGRSTLPARAFLLTFDDGFSGVREHGQPVLERLGWPATVFLVSGLLGRQDSWTVGENPDGKMHPLLTADEVCEMRAAGFTFYSHTCSHKDLTQLSDTELESELRQSRLRLAELLREDIPYLAYPYGRYDDRVRNAAIAAGYEAAFSVQPGFNRAGSDAYGLRRLDVFGTDTPGALLRKITLGTNDGSRVSAARYVIRRAAARMGLPTR